MVGGAAVDEDELTEIVLSLSRLNRVRGIDPIDMTMNERGPRHLEGSERRRRRLIEGCLLPLSISSEGSARIGGVLATDADGDDAVRLRQCPRPCSLRLEIMLADGQVWNGLRGCARNNAGYCLRRLFVGGEGRSAHYRRGAGALSRGRARRWRCADRFARDRAQVFNRLKLREQAGIQGFGCIWGIGLDLVLRHVPSTRFRFAIRRQPMCWWSLDPTEGEMRGCSRPRWARRRGEVISDAVIAASVTQRKALWGLREDVRRRRSWTASRSSTMFPFPSEGAGVHPARDRGAGGFWFRESVSWLRASRRRQHPRRSGPARGHRSGGLPGARPSS